MTESEAPNRKFRVQMGRWNQTRALLLMLLCASSYPAWPRAHAFAAEDIVVEYNVMVAMRDGVRLATDVYRPNASGNYPVILTRNPYGNGSEGDNLQSAQFWVSHGYAYLYQDVRGRYDSEGAWYPVIHEARDGEDTLRWAGEQTWSNGKVAMIGGSYMGLDQWQAASRGSLYLKTIVPRAAAINPYRELHPGGALLLGQAAWVLSMAGRTGQTQSHDWSEYFWHLPVETLDEAIGYQIPFWKDWVRRASYDAYWEDIDMEARIGKLKIPVFSIGGWFDAWLAGTLRGHELLQARTELERPRQKLIIGPWPHDRNASRKAGDIDFGPEAIVEFDRLTLSWIDYWLKESDNAIGGEAPVQLFVMGENRWRSEQTWPPEKVEYRPYYLHSQGGANSSGGNGILSPRMPGDEPFDRYDYDPRDPVPTRGGNLAGVPGFAQGPLEQGEIEARRDVLVYSSQPLEEDLEVTGPLVVTLYAASSARDTDFTAKLVDVYPDGRALNLADGIVRARYRESSREPSLLESGQIYRFQIDLVATSNVFKQGHRVRLEISSSNFPRFDRNLNTGKPLGRDSAMLTARQRVFHDPEHPSHILLPIIPK